MHSFTRVKNIHGHEYIYEITPYYDPKTKRTKHHSKYLGKNINGTPVKVREQNSEEFSVYSYGEFIIPQKIASDLGLFRILSNILSMGELKCLMVLVYNRIIHPLSMRHISHWYEGTILAHEEPDLPLSSQSISELLKKLHTHEIIQQFLQAFLPSHASNSTLLYDVTSITSYSELNTLFEWGYERSGIDLPQVNLSIIMNKDLGIPVIYELYPGSIVDVSTLENILNKLEDVGVNSFTLILDRGFCSSHNILKLTKRAKSWIMPAKRNLSNYEQIISETLFTIENPNNARQKNDRVLYVLPVTIIIGRNQEVSAYLYYDRIEAIREADRLALKLRDHVLHINETELQESEKPKEVYEELAGSYAKFFVYKYSEHKFQISIKRSELEKSKQWMGKFILMKQGDLTWEECLDQYRERDLIEKEFASLKGELEIMPMHVHREETMRGLLFTSFLALIIRMRMDKILHENNELHNKFDVPSIVVELSKLKMIKLLSGLMIKTEMTKKQREILQAFGCSA
jgi:transposase